MGIGVRISWACLDSCIGIFGDGCTYGCQCEYDGVLEGEMRVDERIGKESGGRVGGAGERNRKSLLSYSFLPSLHSFLPLLPFPSSFHFHFFPFSFLPHLLPFSTTRPFSLSYLGVVWISQRIDCLVEGLEGEYLVVRYDGVREIMVPHLEAGGEG